MTETIKVTLAGVDYDIPRMTLGQIRSLEIWDIEGVETRLAEAQRVEGGGDPEPISKQRARTYDHNVGVIAKGMSDAYPDLASAEAIYKLRTTSDEIYTAASKILDFAMPKKATDSGEAPAPAIPPVE
jgi:hypothetical protein